MAETKNSDTGHEVEDNNEELGSSLGVGEKGAEPVVAKALVGGVEPTTNGEREAPGVPSNALDDLIAIATSLQKIRSQEQDLTTELTNLQKRKATFVSKSQVYSAHIKAVNHNKDALDTRLKRLENETQLSNQYLQEHLQERNELREKIKKTEDNRKTITINIQGGLHLKRQAELEMHRYTQSRNSYRDKKEIMAKRKEELTNLVAKCAEQKKTNEEKLAVMHLKLSNLQKELRACDPRHESELDTLQEQQMLLKDMLDGLEQSIAFGARNLKQKQEALKEICREENKVVTLVSELNKKIKEHKDLITAMKVSERGLSQEAQRLTNYHNDAVQHLSSIEKMIASLRQNFQKRRNDQKEIQKGVDRLKETKQKFSEKMLEVLDQQDILSDRIAKIKGILRALDMNRRKLLRKRFSIEKQLRESLGPVPSVPETKSATTMVSYVPAMSLKIDGELVVTAFLIVYEPQSVIHDKYKMCIDMQDITGGAYMSSRSQQTQESVDEVSSQETGRGCLCIFLKDGYQNRFLFDPETGEIGHDDNPVTMLAFSGPSSVLLLMSHLIQENCSPDERSLAAAAHSSTPDQADSLSSDFASDLPPLEPHDLPNLERHSASGRPNDGVGIEQENKHNPESSSSTSRFNFTLEGESHILEDLELKQLINSTPPRNHFRTWKCYFSTYVHGMSLITFSRKMRNVPVSVIIIRDSGKKVFGGYASAPWKVSSHYYGDGECFVYQFGPHLIKYTSTLRNAYYMLSGHNSVSMGGGQHVAIYLDSEFLSGFSGKSDTFNNPSLSSTRDFTCHRFEAWGPDTTEV